MTVNLADTASLLAEVTNVFHTDEDVKTAHKIVETRAAVEQTCREKQEEIKSIIREYTQNVQALEAKASYDGSEVDADKRALNDEKSAVIDSIQQMEDAHQELHSKVGEIRARSSEIGAQLEGVIQQRDIQIPEASTKIRLYEQITDLKWDYGSQNVAGCVIMADKGEIRNFDIPKESKRAIEIADELWDLVA